MRIHAHHVPALLALGLLADAVDATTTTARAETTSSHIYMLSAHINLMDGTDPLTWRLSVPEEQLKPMGILREGDKITITIIDAKEIDFAKWSQKCRRYSHKTCRTSWLFFKKCTHHYEISTSEQAKPLHPIRDNFKTTVTFVPDEVPEVVEEKDKSTLGDGNGQITRRLKGPRLLRFSGKFSMDDPVDKTPPGSKCEGFVKDFVLGEDGPYEWFRLQVNIMAPELDN